MSDLFISYAREDIDIVRGLHGAIEGQGRKAWVDWEGIPPTAEWRPEIFEAIDDSKAFAFVLSPSSIVSDECAKELRHAVEQNKRLIPLLLQEGPEGGPELPAPLARLMWIKIRQDDGFAETVKELIKTIDTNLERVKAHTRLLGRAREWDSRQHHSLLLRSRELEAAERQFVGGAELEPKPTPLQLRYVTASRRRATKMQRITLGSVTFGMIVAITLAIVALVQRQFSERRQAAAIVQGIAQAKPMLALAQAIDETEKWFAKDVWEVRSSLLSALQMPKERAIYQLGKMPPISTVALTPTGFVAAAVDPRFVRGDQKQALALWDGAGTELPFEAIESKVTVLASCVAKPLVLIGTANGALHLWDTGYGSSAQAAGKDAKSQVVQFLPLDLGRAPRTTREGAVEYLPRPRESINSYERPLREGAPSTDGSTPTGAVTAAALSGDCDVIAIATVSGTEVWSRNPKPAIRETLQEDKAKMPRSIAIDRAGRVIARGYKGGSMRWATPSPDGRGFVDSEFAGHASRESVDAIAVSPDGRYLASGDGDVVRLWRIDGSTLAAVGDGFHGHDDRVTALAFEPSTGSFLVSGSRDNSIRVRDLEGNELGGPRLGHDSWIRSVAVAPDARSIVSGSNDGTVRTWAVTARPTPPRCPDTTPRAFVLAVSDDGATQLVRGKSAGRSRLYLQDPACGRKPVAEGEQTQLGTLSPDGRFVAFADEGGLTVTLRDRTGAKPERVIRHPESGLKAIAISSDGETLAIGGNDRIVRTWKTADGTFRDLPREHALPIVSLVFGCDGSVVASGSEDNTVQLWDVRDGVAMGRRMRGHKGWVSAVAISRDGKYIATGSWDRTVRLWDKAGNPMGSPYRGHTDWITHVRFGPQAAAIISQGADHRVGTWPVGGPVLWREEACRQLRVHPGTKQTEEAEIYKRANAICERATLPTRLALGPEGASAPSPRAAGAVEGVTGAMDRNLPQPEPKTGSPFLMPVEDVFYRPGRGTVVTGRIERGIVKVGDEVAILGMGADRETVVTGVDMYRRVTDEGRAGDRVGLVLRGVAKDEVRRGQVLATPGSITPYTKFKAKVTMLTEAEGGRRTPFSNGYRPVFHFRTTEVTGAVHLLDRVEMGMPGATVQVEVELTTPIAMDPKQEFAIREGGRKVAHGVVLQVVR